MKLDAAVFSRRFVEVVAGVSLIVLVASALALITTQYQVRLLFVEIERANDVARRLADDSSQLALDLSKAALPASVSDRALQLGFVSADITSTVMLDVGKEQLLAESLEVRK